MVLREQNKMPFPNFKNKHLHDSMISPSDFIGLKKISGRYPKFRIPECVIICFDPFLMDYAIKKHKTKRLDFIMGKFFVINDTKPKIGIKSISAIGAPAAAVVLEDLIAFGAKRFIAIGAAGTLNKHLKVGDLVLCDKAIRDEGTSSHYVKHSKYSYPSKKIFSKIKKLLDESNQKYFVGPSWTIDAFYRETIEEAKKY